ncbi:MAG: nuclear transport factor 2 family protein [Pseudomonadota bacterium]
MSIRQTLEIMFDAYGRGDLETTYSYFDEGVVHKAYEDNKSLALGANLIGLEALRKRVDTIGGLIAFESYVPQVIITEGDRAAAIIKVSAVHHQTGQRFDTTISHFYVFKDGKVTELIEFFDSALVQVIVGA